MLSCLLPCVSAAQGAPDVAPSLEQWIVSAESSLAEVRQHFGHGQADLVDAIEVRWPDGTETRLENVKANRQVEVKQKGVP